MKFNYLLEKYKIKANVNMLLDMWNEPHRKYHGLNHLIDMNDMIMRDYGNGVLDEKTTEKLLIANLFHDIIYNPMRQDNEQKSADFFLSLCLEKNNSDILDIHQIILDTATHVATTPLSEKFNSYDMNIVERNFEALLEWENGIYEEYKFAGELYKPKRIEFLESLLDKYPLNNTNLTRLIEHLKNEVVRTN